MSARLCFRCVVLIAGMLPVGLVGCNVPELPESLDVALSLVEKETASQGSGPMVLANSSWKAFRKADIAIAGKQSQPGPYGGLLNGGALERPPVDAQIFQVDFGGNGAMAAIHENEHFLPSIYGTDIEVGEEWIPSTLPFLRFHSASYGISLEERFGVAVVVDVKFLNMNVGRAIIYAWGTVDDDRIDGTYGYLLDFTGGLGGIVLDGGGDQYPFYAERVP